MVTEAGEIFDPNVWFLREGLQLYSMLIVAGKGPGAGIIRSDPYIAPPFLIFTPRGL